MESLCYAAILKFGLAKLANCVSRFHLPIKISIVFVEAQSSSDLSAHVSFLNRFCETDTTYFLFKTDFNQSKKGLECLCLEDYNGLGLDYKIVFKNMAATNHYFGNRLIN